MSEPVKLSADAVQSPREGTLGKCTTFRPEPAYFDFDTLDLRETFVVGFGC